MPTPPGLSGYRWPAEWEPHEATWLSWPHNPATWPGLLEKVQAVFGEMAAALAGPGEEEVRILVPDEAIETSARASLRDAGCSGDRVRFFRVPTNDSWIRDSGPIFLVGPKGERLVTNWGYNAWGGKYPPWEDDDRIPLRLAEMLDLPVSTPGMILEGGSIDGDGTGTILTTEQCLLHPNRNPTLDRTAIEGFLRDHLGARRILWLGEGIEGDDTDGHVDDLARFVAPGRVVAVSEDDPADPNHEALVENLRRLRTMRTADDRLLEVVSLPSPGRIADQEGRLPASYANFYIANRAVLVPVFDDRADDEACAILAEVFPGRRIVPIGATALVAGFGAIHCLTQQQPGRPEVSSS